MRDNIFDFIKNSPDPFWFPENDKAAFQSIVEAIADALQEDYTTQDLLDYAQSLEKPKWIEFINNIIHLIQSENVRAEQMVISDRDMSSDYDLEAELDYAFEYGLEDNLEEELSEEFHSILEDELEEEFICIPKISSLINLYPFPHCCSREVLTGVLLDFLEEESSEKSFLLELAKYAKEEHNNDSWQMFFENISVEKGKDNLKVIEEALTLYFQNYKKTPPQSKLSLQLGHFSQNRNTEASSSTIEPTALQIRFSKNSK